MTIFEQPLNERIRNFIRLQQIYTRINHHLNADSEWDIHIAVLLLLDLYEITARADLKGDVVKELKRQGQSLQQPTSPCQFDAEQIANILNRYRSFIETLLAQTGQITRHVKNSTFLSHVRQRCAATGSACAHDLPVYYYWLNMPLEQCKVTVRKWLQPFQPSLDAIEHMLDTSRQSIGFTTHSAMNGFYQQTLQSSPSPRLARVRTEGNLFPEISGNKYRLSLHFFRYVSANQDSAQANKESVFQLALCTI